MTFRIHTLETTAQACMTNPGDVGIFEQDQVVAIMFGAVPVSVTTKTGPFRAFDDSLDLSTVKDAAEWAAIHCYQARWPHRLPNSRKVPVWRLGELQAKVAKINKRAVRHGLEPFRLVLGEVTRETRRTEGGGKQTVPYRQVEIQGPAIRVAGFTFLGRIDHTGETNLVMSVPGAAIPPQYREAAPDCDHCGHVRRRHDTFILRNDAGELRQIGRNCLADYIGHNPEAVLAAFSYLREITESTSDFAGNLGGFKYGADPEDILAFTVAAVERFGWVSKREDQPGRTATALVVGAHMLAPRLADHELPRIVPTDEHRAEAVRVLAWVRESMPRRSEFEQNLLAILNREFVETKLFGYACSALIVYLRAQEREISRQRDREVRQQQPSQNVGTVGERLTLTVQVMGSHTFEGQFGPTTIYRFRDQAGNDLAWFASNDPRFERGAHLTIKGTVKRHQTGRNSGQPETLLSRVVKVATATVLAGPYGAPEPRAVCTH